MLGLVATLAALAVAPPPATLRSLRAAQQKDRSVGAHVNQTAFAILCLQASGTPASNRAIRRARIRLAGQQNADGDFQLTPGGASNAQSTAWAIQGLLAVGRTPSDPDPRLRRAARLP